MPPSPSLPAPPPLLQLNGITKAFGAVQALRGVSFDLYAGEVHALLGENGAGKSTLIKIITGAHAPDSGTMTLKGETLRHLTPAAAHARGIACIYQQPALFPDLSVLENLALRLEPVRAFRRVPWAQRRERARMLLARVGAEIDPERFVRELSMPEQQLVEIAAAVGAGASLVIMDEPTASLTQREQARLFSVVRELRQAGVGVIYISHRLEEIFALADRVTVLRDGASVGSRRVRSQVEDVGAAEVSGEAVEPLTEAALIQLMVGRAVTLTRQARKQAPGAEVLLVDRVSGHAGAVREVSFTLRTGEIVGLAGLVGAGRTELARVLFGLAPASSGEIQVAGRPVTIASPAEALALGLAYVPEDRRRHGIVLELPVAGNISLAVHRRLFPGSWLRPAAERRLAVEQVQRLEIKTSSVDALASTLSGGNQQKVALARWLATAPRILILDEPTQGVDVGAKSEIHRLVRELADAGLAVLLISSDLPEVLSLSDRLLVMRGGRLVTELPGGSDAEAVMAAALGPGRQADDPTAPGERAGAC